LLVNAILLMLVPRRWAPLPLLIGVCYMTVGQGVVLGPFHFTIIRMLVAVGIVRVIARGERMAERVNGLDKFVIAWAAWALFSSVFHEYPLSAFVYRTGIVYNACGIYFLLRVFCRSLDDVLGLCRITAILLVPVAMEMMYETLTSHNLFSAFGRVPMSPVVRLGRIRAQGPFAHSILAGTIGAVCLPLVFGLWRQYRRAAVAGIGACVVMIVASASSGPILSAAAACGALGMWYVRHQLRLIRWLAVIGYLGLVLVMKDPVYFIIARSNLVGGSTGWFRARLIQSAIEHLPEWYLGGTDYTRHWMPTGVQWSADHTDITNQYLLMGVIGGLPLMLLFIGIVLKGFGLVGRALRRTADFPAGARFTVWALGASLFAHAVTFVSVAYFDQSFLFVYLTLALIAATQTTAVAAPADADHE
jgi:hypothetical protein